MATNIVSPQGDGNAAGLIVGLVLAALIIAAAIFFGLPYLRSMQGQPQQQMPTNINVTLPTPAPSPAPAPQPSGN